MKTATRSRFIRDARATTRDFLLEALTAEISGVLRFKRHYFRARELRLPNVAEQFLCFAHQSAVRRLADRLKQLGGEDEIDTRDLVSRSHLECLAEESLPDMVCGDLLAERLAIDSYSSMIRWLGDRDPETRHLMEEILHEKERHADMLLKTADALEL